MPLTEEHIAILSIDIKEASQPASLHAHASSLNRWLPGFFDINAQDANRYIVSFARSHFLYVNS